MREQLKKLILEPLLHISAEAHKDRTLLIIVDTLDKYDGKEDVKLLIELLSSSKELQSPQLKVFLTSRPELPIRFGFKAIEGTYQSIIVHEIAESIIEHGMRVLLLHKLA